MDRKDLEQAKLLSCYKTHYANAQGGYSVWVYENGDVHPWPFSNLQELLNWAGSPHSNL